MTEPIEKSKEEVLRDMHKCLDIANTIWELLERECNKISENVHVLSLSEMDRAVAKHFSTPLADARRHALGRATAHAFGEEGLTNCGMWLLAHLLDHVLFDEDLSEFQ